MILLYDVVCLGPIKLNIGYIQKYSIKALSLRLYP